MTGGLPQPAVNEIPVTQVSVETYELVWKHRRRIAYWSIAPFVLCTLIWFAEDEFTASDLIKGSYVLESANSFGWLVLGTLITVPFQVVVHRLTYPGFDFDLGTYGPPLREVNKYYFIYSFLLFNFAFIVFYNLVYVLRADPESSCID